MNNKKIGIWGVPNSGKTTYLSAMLIELEEREKWDIGPQSQISETQKTPESAEFAISLTRRIKQGQFPDATEGAKELYFYFHRWIGPIKQGFYLYLLDAPGGLSAESESKSIGLINLYEDYYSYLASCDGILVLVDPLGNNQYGDIKQLIHELTQREAKPFVAFCVTKIDEFPELWAIRNSGDDLLKKVIGSDVYDLASRYFKIRYGFSSRMKSFGVSVVGTRQVGGNDIPNIRIIPKFQRKEMAMRKRTAYNVLEPVKWLLDKTRSHG